MGAGFYLTSSTASPAYTALYSGAFIISKIEYIIPQFGTTRQTMIAIMLRQAMPEAKPAQIPTARFKINDAHTRFVDKPEQAVCCRTPPVAAMKQIKGARRQIGMFRERVSFLHCCTFFVLS